jgi:hypothetical protein
MVLSLSGVMCLALSLAEMASICPISGAQYHVCIPGDQDVIPLNDLLGSSNG